MFGLKGHSQRIQLLWLVTVVILGLKPVLAQTQTSASFQSPDSSFAPAVFEATSPNFQINGAIDSIVGASASPSFNVKHGVPLKDPALPVTPPLPPPPPSGGGGGPGGGSLPPAPTASTTPTPSGGLLRAPTLIYRGLTFKSLQSIGGSFESDATNITVNGSSNGVSILPNRYWQKQFPLFVGYNDIHVKAVNNSNGASVIIFGQIERMLIGDSSREMGITKHHVVDDVDLSLFTRAWKKYSFFSDFNEDNLIDDIDLSLLASHWSLTADY